MEQSQCLSFPKIIKLLKLSLSKGGFGYSDKVDASVTGSGGQDFILGPVFVSNGSIKEVGIIKTGTWADTPLAYHGSDEHPFSGTVETKLAGGQILEKAQYLSGKKHGKHTRYSERGVPVFSKDYVGGKKHGTHFILVPKSSGPR